MSNEDHDTGLPPSMPLPQQINHLLGQIARLKKRIEDHEKPTERETAEDLAAEKTRQIEEKRRERETEERRAADRAILIAKTAAIRALVKLLPKAIAQANLGKPALLRLILRATK